MAKNLVTYMQAESLGTAEGRNSFQIVRHNLDHQAPPILMSSEAQLSAGSNPLTG